MDCDVIIIGAGVVGLAIAMKLSEKYSCTLFEQHSSFGEHTSSRNSEVIHAGIYYPSDSLKTRLAIEGNPLLYSFCSKNSINCKKIGKYIIATEETENVILENIYKNGKENGVPNLRLATSNELSEAEPNIIATSAIFSPETGIIDSHNLMAAFEYIARQQNAMFAYNHKVIGIEKIAGGYKVHLLTTDGEKYSCKASIVINSAGLESDTIAKLAGIDISEHRLVLNYCKGSYFKINNSSKYSFRHLIYPVPNKAQAGLGVHITIDLQGNAKLGPNAEYTNNRIYDYSVADNLLESFYNAAKRYIKHIEPGDISPDYSGIRPKLQLQGESFRDFYISEESNKGLPGLINLIGIESPGLTASIAIANYVDRLL